MIPAPDDLGLKWHDPERCKEESPAWGYEGEGGLCERRLGHDGPHYLTAQDIVTRGTFVMQWELRKEGSDE